MLRVGVFLAVCAVAYGHDPYGNRHYEEPEYLGRPLKLVDISRLSHGYNEHDSIEEKIAKEVLGPVYVTPQNVIDYRYLKKGGRAYKQGFGGQINILPHKPTPGDYQHVFDHLLQELLHREIANDRERGQYGHKKPGYIDTTPIRLIKPDHEVSPHYHEHKVQELKHEHEHRPREEFRPREELKPVYEIKKEPEHRPHHEHKPNIPQWPIFGKIQEHKQREPVYNNWGGYEQKQEERPRYEIKPEERPRHERPYEHQQRPRYEPRHQEHRTPEAHKPHHIPWVQ